jgi:hypothetical protein
MRRRSACVAAPSRPLLAAAAPLPSTTVPRLGGAKKTRSLQAAHDIAPPGCEGIWPAAHVTAPPAAMPRHHRSFAAYTGVLITVRRAVFAVLTAATPRAALRHRRALRSCTAASVSPASRAEELRVGQSGFSSRDNETMRQDPYGPACWVPCLTCRWLFWSRLLWCAWRHGRRTGRRVRTDMPAACSSNYGASRHPGGSCMGMVGDCSGRTRALLAGLTVALPARQNRRVCLASLLAIVVVATTTTTTTTSAAAGPPRDQ